MSRHVFDSEDSTFRVFYIEGDNIALYSECGLSAADIVGGKLIWRTNKRYCAPSEFDRKYISRYFDLLAFA